uniref:Uncharacterized protein n=1 Tax=Rousettus aegyptiacus TaxID=9407 RepID=A0A7J8IM16_ROUAE|nr:hypothetical protein HJG63_010595 [Rousettus aegyptiacus]
MNQFFISFRKRRFSHNCCFLLPPFSPLPDVIFKSCVHVANKYVSKILHSFIMGTHLSPELRCAENIHFFYFPKIQINFYFETLFHSRGRDLISMFGTFCFSFCPRGLCLNSGPLPRNLGAYLRSSVF